MNIFCSGIGGAGVSAYAAYQNASGHTVSGSDCSATPLLEALRAQGITVSLLQDGSAIPPETDLFVFTLALPEDHPERLRAKELGIPAKSYFEALGDLARESGKHLIAVCGTHGKSSTTAMAAKMLIEADVDPDVILGVNTEDLQGKNWRKGGNESSLKFTSSLVERRSRHEPIFLVESCEYRRSFLHLSPSVILLTNADGDHLDYFRDLTDYEKAFEEFISLLPDNGVLITHEKEESVQRIIDAAKKRGIRMIDADAFPLPALSIPGHHMRENAQLALALGDLLAIDQKSALASLAAYRGSSRRMEIKGKTKGGALVIDDYGHHPREISATLQALKEEYLARRIVCVFQPHTHDRTLKFYDAFTKAFRDADLVIIPNIFDVRKERDSGTVNVLSFVSDIALKSHTEVIDGHSLDETEKLLGTMLTSRDVLVTMGAGDVWRVAQQLTVDN